jgi:hypothetical protein
VLHAGLGLAIGMVVILTAFNVGRTFYLDAVKSANRDAAAAVYDPAGSNRAHAVGLTALPDRT